MPYEGHHANGTWLVDSSRLRFALALLTAVKNVRAVLAVLVTLSAGQAFSQNATDASPSAKQFEATAFVGYRGGGSFDIQDSDESADVGAHFSYALALNYQIDNTSGYELFYSRQATQVSLGADHTDLDVNYFMLGGTLIVDEMSALQPYIVGLVGAARLSPDAPDTNARSRFAISLGLGVRVPLRERIALRLEARGYVTFVDTDSAVFCSSGGSGSACLLRGSGSTFLQGELLAGIAIAF